MIALVLGLGIGLAVVASTSGCRGRADKQALVTRYHCPMHPAIVSDKPGECPICGMTLVPMDEVKPDTAKAAATKTKIMYRSTMNPNEVSDKPGKDSMGMDRVAFEVPEEGEPVMPEGLAAVTISPELRQRMGLTLGVVERRSLVHEIRTSARIVADETRLYRVTTKFEGWVENLFVNVTGQQVKKGDPLLSVYSPELVSTQQEYLTALGAARQVGRGSDETAERGASALLDAARRRLQYWDIGDAQIERLERTGKVEKNLVLYSPAGGWVTEKNVVAGQKIMPGDPLLAVSDLTSVWGDADVYQSDLPYVKVGTPAAISIPYWENKTFTGTVAFVSPTLDPVTRTAKARLNIDNPELLLKPEMFADARLSYPIGEGLSIPEAAVMRSGEHTYAFKNAGEGRLVPVEIDIGPRGGGYYQLLGGLNEGDRVVTSANFLVDSESSLEAALSSMSKASGAGAESDTASAAGTEPAGGGHAH